MTDKDETDEEAKRANAVVHHIDVHLFVDWRGHIRRFGEHGGGEEPPRPRNKRDNVQTKLQHKRLGLQESRGDCHQIPRLQDLSPMVSRLFLHFTPTFRFILIILLFVEQRKFAGAFYFSLTVITTIGLSTGFICL